MLLAEVLAALERAGSMSTKMTLLRHGARAPLYGVSYAELGRLQQRIRRDHSLARQLWGTGNHDARVLATMVADPERADEALLEEWLHDSNQRPLAIAFTAFAARTTVGRVCARRWIEELTESRQAAGWGVIAAHAADESARDAEFAPLLPRIERSIRSAPNHARAAMNKCLIAIGARPGLYRAALALAQQIGPVAVDHGDTDCETPLASERIEAIAARRLAKAGKGKAATKTIPRSKSKAKGPAKPRTEVAAKPRTKVAAKPRPAGKPRAAAKARTRGKAKTR